MRRPRDRDALLVGRVVANHGRDATIADEAGRRLRCRMQGRRLAVVCGDRVRWLSADGQSSTTSLVLTPIALSCSAVTSPAALWFENEESQSTTTSSLR